MNEIFLSLFKKPINTQKVTPISEENTVNKLSENQIKEFILTNQEFVKISQYYAHYHKQIMHK